MQYPVDEVHQTLYCQGWCTCHQCDLMAFWWQLLDTISCSVFGDSSQCGNHYVILRCWINIEQTESQDAPSKWGWNAKTNCCNVATVSKSSGKSTCGLHRQGWMALTIKRKGIIATEDP